jgi:hypothetical protein
VAISLFGILSYRYSKKCLLEPGSTRARFRSRWKSLASAALIAALLATGGNANAQSATTDDQKFELLLKKSTGWNKRSKS